MNIIDIPFNSFIGLKPFLEGPEYLLMLDNRGEYANHLGTVHASALFALAEASSGEFLLRECGQIEGLVPVVRTVELKYKKPAKGMIFSGAEWCDSGPEKLFEELDRKNRALVSIKVSLFDESKINVMHATFEWFITKLPK